jgi:hypothetical protein
MLSITCCQLLRVWFRGTRNKVLLPPSHHAAVAGGGFVLMVTFLLEVAG